MECGSQQRKNKGFRISSMAISLFCHGIVVAGFFLANVDGFIAVPHKKHLNIGLSFKESRAINSEKTSPKNSALEKKELEKRPTPPSVPVHAVGLKKANQIAPKDSLASNAAIEINDGTEEKNPSFSAGLGEDIKKGQRQPLLINHDEVKIPYPEQARERRIEGTVLMKLTVAETGKVIDVDIISGPAYGLRQAALMVARKLFFLPATDEEGHARVAHVKHEVIFRLKS